MPVNDPRFDFLAVNATTHAILANGRRITPTGPLPRGSGTHLVAGTAQVGALEHAGTLPDESDMSGWSPNHRWLGVYIDDALVLLDAENDLRRGFAFHIPDHYVIGIHPTGEMVAVRDDDGVALLLPDGEELVRVAVPMRHPNPTDEGLTFSASGEYLWLAISPPDGPDELVLFRVPDLHILGRTKSPFDPSVYHDDEEAGWANVTFRVNPFADGLIIGRADGDSRLSLTSVRVEDGRIGEYHHLTPDERINVEPIVAVTFSPDGGRVVTVDVFQQVVEWSLPGCQPERVVECSELHADPESGRYIETAAFAGDVLLAGDEGILFVLRPGTLETVGVLSAWFDGRILPNGMLLVGDDGGSHLKLLRIGATRSPAVFELDSSLGVVTRAWGRTPDGSWEDITAKTLWAVTAFDVGRDSA